MSSPFFSVIMPTYNRAEFLNRSISSVINQSFNDWELLIVDDGSIDNTKTVVENIAKGNRKIKYLYQENQKASVARNLGLQLAKGKYICFLDSDDEYRVDHLQLFFDYLKQSQFPESFLCTGLVLDRGTVKLDFSPPKLAKYDDRHFNQIMSVFLPFSPCVQTICLPSTIKGHVQFDPRLFPSECYDFCARAAAFVSEVKFFPATTVVLHEHENNVSIPKTESDAFKFNLRQYEEFRIMSKDVFYKEIKKTQVFQDKIFFLKMEIARAYLRKRKLIAFTQSFLKAISYNPGYIFKSNFLQFTKRLSKKTVSFFSS